jgi:hypothetical protein
MMLTGREGKVWGHAGRTEESKVNAIRNARLMAGFPWLISKQHELKAKGRQNLNT